jgi:hypothetical protein
MIKHLKPQLPFNSLKGFKIKNNTPLLFNKKIKNIVIKPLIYVRNDTGKTKHYTPAAQE